MKTDEANTLRPGEQRQNLIEDVRTDRSGEAGRCPACMSIVVVGMYNPITEAGIACTCGKVCVKLVPYAVTYRRLGAKFAEVEEQFPETNQK